MNWLRAFIIVFFGARLRTLRTAWREWKQRQYRSMPICLYASLEHLTARQHSTTIDFLKRHPEIALSGRAVIVPLATLLFPLRWNMEALRSPFAPLLTAQYIEAVWCGVVGAPAEGFDGVDFAVYSVKAIRRSLEAGVLKDAVANPRLFTVWWVEPDGKVGGHTVVLLDYPGLTTGRTWLAYFDYEGGSCRPPPPGARYGDSCSMKRLTAEEVAVDVMYDYAPPTSHLIAWRAEP